MREVSKREAVIAFLDGKKVVVRYNGLIHKPINYVNCFSDFDYFSNKFFIDDEPEKPEKPEMEVPVKWEKASVFRQDDSLIDISFKQNDIIDCLTAMKTRIESLEAEVKGLKTSPSPEIGGELGEKENSATNC